MRLGVGYVLEHLVFRSEQVIIVSSQHVISGRYTYATPPLVWRTTESDTNFPHLFISYYGDRYSRMGRLESSLSRLRSDLSLASSQGEGTLSYVYFLP